MATFSCRYLTSTPFRQELSEEIQRNFLVGYYNLQDYVVTCWWGHIQATTENVSKLSHETRKELELAFSEFERVYSVCNISQNQAATHSPDLLGLFTQLPKQPRQRDATLTLGSRIERIRSVIESYWATETQKLGRKDYVGSDFHGPRSYKCPKTWCHHFTDGFSEVADRENHIKEHDMPFKCSVEGCYASNIGFSTATRLRQHENQNHEQSDQLRFPFSRVFTGQKLHQKILSAIDAGDLETVKSLVDMNQTMPATKLQSINLKKALVLAVKRGQLHICECLMANGVNPFDRPLFDETALSTAVLQDDIDIVMLLLQHPACTATDVFTRTARNAFSPAELAASQNSTQILRCFKSRFPEQFCTVKYFFQALRASKFKNAQSLLAIDNTISERLWQDDTQKTSGWQEVEPSQIQEYLHDYESRHVHDSSRLQQINIGCILLELCRRGYGNMVHHVVLLIIDFEDKARIQTAALKICVQMGAYILIKDLLALGQLGTQEIAEIGFSFIPRYLHEAEQHSSIVYELVMAQDSFIHVVDANGATAMHCFALSGRSDIIQQFLSVVEINKRMKSRPEHAEEILPPRSELWTPLGLCLWGCALNLNESRQRIIDGRAWEVLIQSGKVDHHELNGNEEFAFMLVAAELQNVDILRSVIQLNNSLTSIFLLTKDMEHLIVMLKEHESRLDKVAGNHTLFAKEIESIIDESYANVGNGY
jgi:hypothetical protein